MTLQKIFPSLTLFSDLDWNTVEAEYKTSYADISFPEYLQIKAEEGDAPEHLFELAFYELALFQSETIEDELPTEKGIYLNPTALFLSLEFDVVPMIQKAQKGEIEVIEREHVLGIYRDALDEMHSVELDDDELGILEYLEDGPQESKRFVDPKDRELYTKLVQRGLIIEV